MFRIFSHTLSNTSFPSHTLFIKLTTSIAIPGHSKKPTFFSLIGYPLTSFMHVSSITS